jgi:ubiquinone biosynthesis protein
LPLFLLVMLRGLRISLLAAWLIPQFLLRRPFDRNAGPALLRRFLQSAGAGFVKLGQLLATRYDLISPAYSEELSKLFDQMPFVPLAVVQEVVERDLKLPLGEIYRSFDPDPLASASIAQVHGAILHTGQAVVVKVMRPGIAERFRVDLAFLRIWARLSRQYHSVFHMDLTAVARDLAELTREELDFRREARNTDTMHRLMRGDEVDHRAPEVFFAFCGEQAITMERLDGVSAVQLIAAVERNEVPQLEAWAQRGITPQRTARLVLRSILEQTMRHRVFHADPHPANLIVMDGGTLAWIDFGMLGWLDERSWDQQFKLRMAIASGRVHGAYEALLEALEPLPATDLSGFEREVKTITRDYIEASASPNAGMQEKSSGYFFARLFGAIRRGRVSLPSDVVRLYRTVIIADMIMLRLAPEIDWIPMMRGFLEAETRRQIAVSLEKNFSGPAVSQVMLALLRAPAATAETIQWINTRLPRLGRFYEHRLSVIERWLIMALSYLRGWFIISLLVIAGARLVATPYLPGSWWAAMDRLIGSFWWPLILIGLFAVIGLRRVLDEIEKP